MNRSTPVLILAMVAFWLCLAALGVQACEKGSMVEQILSAITPALESEPFP
jgi:hypothetical protein